MEDILGFVYTDRMPHMHVFAVISFKCHLLAISEPHHCICLTICPPFHADPEPPSHISALDEFHIVIHSFITFEDTKMLWSFS